MNTVNSLRHRSPAPRKIINFAATATGLLATMFGVFVLGWILWVVIGRGFTALNLDLLFSPTKPYFIPDGGLANAIVGTVIITCVASALAIPPGLLGGVYLSEFGSRGKLGEWLRFSANVMMGMPSIIVGLFVYTILVYTTKCFSGFAGSVALAIIMFPVVVRVTEDMLAMVPNALREACLAMGMPRWRATLGIIFKSARSGLVTGILLAVARVSGETAPLLFTALWSDAWPMFRDVPGRGIALWGDWHFVPSAFFTNPTANLTVTITEYATNSPFEVMQTRAWGGALLITAAVLLVNIVVRTILRSSHK